MDSSDTKSLDWLSFSNLPDSLDWLEFINIGFCNTLRFKDTLSIFLEDNCLDKMKLVTILDLAPKIWAFQVHQCYNVALFSFQYKKIPYKNG